MTEFASGATAARWPSRSYLQPGDMIWQLFAANSPAWWENIHLWEDDHGLAAYAIFEPPLDLEFDVRPDISIDGPLTRDLLGWAESRRRTVAHPGGDDLPIAYQPLGQGVLMTAVLDSDTARIRVLNNMGFEKHPQHGVCYRRSLAEPVDVPLPDGARVRHATDADIAERAELHRDAWSVWGKSRFSESAYRLLRDTPGYDEELDVVVEAPDGRLVSYCIAWADQANGIGHFEPVGARPAYTGKGYGRAAVLEGLRRLRARGMHTAVMGTSSVNEPALRLYPACGFEYVESRHAYVKRVV
jgi:ribosomal protein S18 acetylase RimI-like enzyme